MVLISLSCVDDGLVDFTADNNERLLSTGSSKEWTLLERFGISDQDSCEFLVFDTSDGVNTYQRELRCDGDTIITETGTWSYALGTIDSIKVTRDTVSIATDTIITTSTSLTTFVFDNANVTDTAVIYRDTVPEVKYTWTIEDSLFITTASIVDTLFAIVDTIRFRDSEELWPTEFPSDVDTQFVLTDTARQYLYNASDIEELWSVELLTLERLEILVNPGSSQFTEKFESVNK